MDDKLLVAEVLSERDADARADLGRAVAIADAVRARGGYAMVVGGFVRDVLLRRLGPEVEAKDLDIEIYGLDPREIVALVNELGPADAREITGTVFDVVKAGRIDISVPRRVSRGSDGTVVVETDPSMPVQEAIRYRDLTINAIGWDPLAETVVDPSGGREDLKRGVLRAVDEDAFGADPLRVVRVMQFAARFGFRIDVALAQLCRRTSLHGLPTERVGEEWRKLLLRSDRPSVGLRAGRSLEVLQRLHPELAVLAEVPQDPSWHPEGDVWTHTLLVLDEAAAIVRRERLEGADAYVLLLAALCHDLGKAETTEHEPDGRITSYGHEQVSVSIAERFMASIDVPPRVVRRVLPLVDRHMYLPMKPDPSDAALRRLATRLHPATVRELVWLTEADKRGRGSASKGFPEAARVIERAAQLDVSDARPKPIVLGRHLLEEGVAAGPEMGKLLEELYEAQIAGAFQDLEGGLNHFRTHRF